jgi:hypothetical protein
MGSILTGAGGYGMYGRKETCIGCWWREMKERTHLEDLGVDWDNIKIDLQGVGWRGAWTGSIWLWIGAGCGPRECGNKTSGSIQCRGFLEDRGILVQFTLYVCNRFFCSPKKQAGFGARPDSYWRGAGGEGADMWKKTDYRTILTVKGKTECCCTSTPSTFLHEAHRNNRAFMFTTV